MSHIRHPESEDKMPAYKARWTVRGEPLYMAWLNLRNRCNNTRAQDYKYYGGRGICCYWGWDDFDLFARHVGPHPGRGWTLDRINTNGHYTPFNVRWATRQDQARNRPDYNKLTKQLADQIRLEYIPGKVRQVDLAAKYGVNQAHVSAVIRGAIWK